MRTRLADDGNLREQNYTPFWRVKKAEEQIISSVGIAIKNSLLPTLEYPTGETDRLLNLKMSTRTGLVNLLCAYAPTLCSTVKDQFYNALDSTWPSITGYHGVEKMNGNGQRLLELCSVHNLAITNTFFEYNGQHKLSWHHPRSNHWHQLDMILCRKRYLNSVKDTRRMYSAECDTDHILIRSQFNFAQRKMHHPMTNSLTRITASRASCKVEAQRLHESLRTPLGRGRGDATTAGTKWEQVRTTRRLLEGKNTVTWAGLRQIGRR